MSKLFSELSKEAEQQQKALQKRKSKKDKNQTTDVPTPVSDVDARRQAQSIDKNKLKTIISELSEISVSTYGAPVRLSETEKQDIEDFIYITLRKNGVNGKVVSSAKLMRYALRYLMKVHKELFIMTLVEALKKEEQLSI